MATDNTENSYRNILKRITAFGGVQLFNIFVTLLRGKFVAMFLGPEGMGISSLFTSSTNTLQQFSGLGLNLSIVKEVAASKDDAGRLGEVMSVAVRLMIITSFIGGALCLVLSPLLSLWTFGSSDYTVGFMLLSLSVALSIAASGYMALLQGVGAVRRLAKASLVGGLTGLLCGVPLYYFFGFGGIVPSIIILSFATFMFYFISFRREGYPIAEFAGQLNKPLAKKLLSTGVILMIGSLLGTLTGYLINMFVRYSGSMADVGLYQAANSMTNQYMGIVFSALALDYFPRLSAAASDRDRFNSVVNRQIEIVALIATPLVICLIGTAPLIIKVLLTDSFMQVAPLIKWMGVGILSQALYFPIGYMFIARDNKKLYMWVEVIAGNLLWIVFAVSFYHAMGLIGLGVSFLTLSVVTNIIGYAAVRRVYGFRLSRRNIYYILLSLSLAATAFASSTTELTAYTVIPVLFIVSAGYSFITLRRHVNIR